MSEQPEEHKVVVRDRRKIDPVTGVPREPEPEPADAGLAAAGAAGSPVPPPPAPDVAESLRAQLAERTADLQRITAEYANYRKRVDRDRASVVEGATGSVLSGLLPVLDDIERARDHGDLTGAFKAVADQLEGVLEKLGLRPFGVAGDPFDPMLHEAVAHQTSPDVAVPSCAQVLRRGYRHGDRLLRPALVAVVDPEPVPPPQAEPVAPSDLPGSDLPGEDRPGGGLPGSDLPRSGVPGSDLPGSDLPGSGLPGSDQPGTGAGSIADTLGGPADGDGQPGAGR